MLKTKRQLWMLILVSLFMCVFLLGGCAQQLGAFEISLPDAAALAASLEAAALEVMEFLHDEYAAYFTPEEFQLLMDSYFGSFAGIGISMVQDEDGLTIVYEVMPDRPALAAGLEPGDIILLVDGESVAGLDVGSVATRLRGEEGTDVEVTLQRDTDDGYYEYTVVITRAVIESISINGQLLADYPGLAYIRIREFSENTPQDFSDIFNLLNQEHAELHNGQQISGLILDLRYNGGGSFNAAIRMAQFFVPDGLPIVREKVYNRYIYHRSNNGGQLVDIAVVCLQNGSTASSSEVFIGALRDHGIAEVVGSVSFGKGITQVLRPLSHGGGLRYTQSRYFTPNHFDLHNRGLEPDVEVLDEDVTMIAADYFNPEYENNRHVQEAIALLLRRI